MIAWTHRFWRHFSHYFQQRHIRPFASVAYTALPATRSTTGNGAPRGSMLTDWLRACAPASAIVLPFCSQSGDFRRYSPMSAR